MKKEHCEVGLESKERYIEYFDVVVALHGGNDDLRLVDRVELALDAVDAALVPPQTRQNGIIGHRLSNNP